MYGKRKATSTTPSKQEYPYSKRRSVLSRKLKFGKQSFSQRVKEIVRKEVEAPHHSIWDITATSIYHGNLYTSSLLTEIAQGTSNATRIGDEIFIEAFKTRFMLLSAPSTTTIAWRVMLIKSGIEKLSGSGGGWNSATGVSANDVFFVGNPGGDYNYPGRGVINPKQATVLYDEVFEMNECVANQNLAKNVQVTIPIRAKHIYNQNNGYGKFKNYYWLVTAYQNGGTAGATLCGNISMQTDIVFKNEA